MNRQQIIRGMISSENTMNKCGKDGSDKKGLPEKILNVNGNQNRDMVVRIWKRKVYSSISVIIILLISITTNLHLSIAETKNRTPKYVGTEACKNCHKGEYERFMTYARKSRSFQSIERVKKGLTEEEIKGCYSCHTTGYRKPGGFVSPEKTPHLKIAGCEVCHGPGEFHVKTKSREDIRSKLTIKDCEVCHTEERVRAFRYKPLIRGGAH